MLVFLSAKGSCRLEPDLLSIALVTADGAEFYAERIDFYPDSCSIHAEEHILPLMGRVQGAACTGRRLTRRLTDWLRRLPEPATVACADHQDWDLLSTILESSSKGKYRHLLFGHLLMPNRHQLELCELFAYRSAYSEFLPEGHALADARALRAVFGAGAGVANEREPQARGRTRGRPLGRKASDRVQDVSDYRE